ncbi:phage portal protein [Lysinibacillus telephonicus]|uniref:phage portal protein n=1 Tax=Lysinibacillus telephonicus TaxID=1714840 RepID=UPI0031FC6E62
MLIEDLYRAPWHESVMEVIKQMANQGMSLDEFLIMEITDWEKSDKYKQMVEGGNYYRHKMDIDKKERKLKVIDQSNQKLKHNFVKKLVDQKIGYLLSNEPTIGTRVKEYTEMLNERFDYNLLKKLKSAGREAINKGIAYLHPYIDEEGNLQFKRYNSEEIIPFWRDIEENFAESFIRVYQEERIINKQKKKVKCVEYHYSEGIQYYTLELNQLKPDDLKGIEQRFHFTIDDKPYLWERIPLIPIRYNEYEEPLIVSIKSLVDNYNAQTSTHADLLLDIPNVIMKLRNYGGTDLTQFLQELARYRVVKLDDDGDLESLKNDVATDSIEKELDRERKAIYEFGRGVDTTENENLGNASGVALKFRYTDLDLDCNDFENEFQASLEQIFWFISHYILITTGKDYTEEPVNFTFNRAVIINENEKITMAKDSIGILDDQTIRENHPWYHDGVEERLKQQQQEEMDLLDNYETTFNKLNGGGANGQE